jgi:hypothetical protein
LTFSVQCDIFFNQEDTKLKRIHAYFAVYFAGIFAFLVGLVTSYGIEDEIAGRPIGALAIGDLTFRSLLFATRGLTIGGLIACVITGWLILSMSRNQRS